METTLYNITAPYFDDQQKRDIIHSVDQKFMETHKGKKVLFSNEPAATHRVKIKVTAPNFYCEFSLFYIIK